MENEGFIEAIRRGKWRRWLVGSAQGEAKLGTFLGVFTPSILTILGVILYLRTGWVVGNVGLFPALAIVVIANLITLATALSVSAITTNMYVGAGGAYYILSRSLGLEIGGAIGVPLFLAQTFSVTLYAFGFAESLRFVWPDVPLQPVAAAVVLLVSLIAARGADVALRLQIPIMVFVGLSLLSLFAGLGKFDQVQVSLWQGLEQSPSFWLVFAVYFPAVTGIMAGVSLSGDLKEPRQAIPRGTIAAVLVGFVIYFTVPIALALGADAKTLIDDPLVWMKISAIPILILPGLWGAILSSAMGSILGAPRTLDALAQDGVVPGRFLSLQLGPFGGGHLLSAMVALVAVTLGDLNAVAPVLTMFFLTTYGMVNLVAGLEQLSGSPSYRPTLRVPSYVSLAGALGCLWVMYLINPLASVVAVVAEVGIYFGLRRRALKASWGDLRYGALMSLARAALLQLRNLPVAPRNWRPHILVFAGDIDRRVDLVRFAAWLNQDRGILTVSKLLIGPRAKNAPRVGAETAYISERLEEEGITAFPKVEIVTSYEEGAIAVAQADGIAGLSSNTVMFGWSAKLERITAVLRIMRELALMGKSTVICRVRSRGWTIRPRRIDVWWGGLQNNGDMLLLFAYLISVNPEWRSARILVRSVATNEMMASQTERMLRQKLEESRIDADIETSLVAEGVSIQAIIQEKSRDADIVLMGLRQPGEGQEDEYASRLAELLGDLPTVVLVRAAGLFSGQLLETNAMPSTTVMDDVDGSNRDVVDGGGHPR